MPLIAEPWARIRTRVPIPADLKALTDVEFAELLRSHLTPFDPTKPADRAVWTRFWDKLRGDEDLTERTYDTLEEFRDQAEDALDSGELDDVARKRASKFLSNCESGWQRIDREPPVLPLDWAGKAGNFTPHARRVIAQFVSAIAHHRSVVISSMEGPRPEDDELWRVLRRVNLDPRDYAPAKDR